MNLHSSPTHSSMVSCSPLTHSLMVLCVAFFRGLLNHILAPFLLPFHLFLLLMWDSLVIVLIYVIVSSITRPLYTLSTQCSLFVPLLFPGFYSFFTSFFISLCKVHVRGLVHNLYLPFLGYHLLCLPLSLYVTVNPIAPPGY